MLCGVGGLHILVGSLDLIVSCKQQVPFLNIDREAQARHSLGFHLCPFGRGGEETDTLGMVHEIAYGVGSEIEQDGYCHRAVGVDGQEDHTPAGAVVGADCHLVVFGFNAGGGHKQIEFFYADGHLAKTVAFASNIVQRFLVPVLANRFLQTGKVVRIFCYHFVILS